MSRQTTSVHVVPLITKNTRLEELPDIDPDAIRALADEGIETIRQLRATTKDITLIVHQAMKNRPRAASASAFQLRRYRTCQLDQLVPKNGIVIHDRMHVRDIPGITDDAVRALLKRGISTLGQVRGRKSQIPTILQQEIPSQAREVHTTIRRCLNPGSPLQYASSS